MRSKNVLIYGVGELISKLLMFFLMPFLAIVLSVEEFASASIVIPFIQIMQGVFSFGLSVSLMKLFYDKPGEKNILFSHTIVVWFIVNMIIMLCSVLLMQTPSLKGYKVGIYMLEDIYIYIILATNFLSLSVIALQKFQAQKKAINFIILNISIKFFLVLSFLILFNINHLTLINILYVYVILAAVFAVISLLILLRGIKFTIKWDKEILQTLMVIGAPAFLNGIVGFSISINGKLMLNSVMTISDLSIFSFFMMIYQSSFLLFAVFSRVYLPVLFEKLSNDSFDNNFYNYNLLLLLLTVYIYSVIIFFFFKNYGFLFFKDIYVDNLLLLTIFLSINFIYCLYITCNDIISYFKKIHINVMINFCILVAMVFLTYYAIKNYGLLGAVIMQALVNSVYYLVVSIYATKLIVFKIKYGLVFVNIISFYFTTQFFSDKFIFSLVLFIITVLFNIYYIYHLSIRGDYENKV